MSPRNVKLVFLREVRDQLRDRRTLFMIVVLPLLLYPSLGIGMFQMMTTFREQPREVVILGASNLPDAPGLLDDEGIRTKWFTGGEADSSKTHVGGSATCGRCRTATTTSGRRQIHSPHSEGLKEQSRSGEPCVS
jgi:hypothetical protein